MKITNKRILSALLTVIMILTLIPLGGISPFAAEADTKELSSYSVGDIITFGSYPQSRVTDSSLISAIEAAGSKLSWVNYGYYSGTGDNSDGNMKPDEDIMCYKDISYNGCTYRAVQINKYRSRNTGYSKDNYPHQRENGYNPDNIYYFKYEPLTWRILDPSEGFVMCTTAIDAQAFNNYVVYDSSSDEYYGDSAKTYYASNWENSSLRYWLNNDFYSIAFSSTEKSQIKTTYNENKSIYKSQYDSADTSDKIFLLSQDEVINSKYGFSSNNKTLDTARRIKSTDYAKCQGCWQSTAKEYNGNTCWILRSSTTSHGAADVDGGGAAHDYRYANSAYSSIVPAFRLNLKPVVISLSTPTLSASNVASSGKIKLTWNAVDGAKEYKVYRATSKDGTYIYIKTTASTSFINTGAAAGKTYYYKVKAVADESTGSEYSEIKTRTCDLAKPVVTATNSASSGLIKLAWDAIEGATSYEVYRATSKNGTYNLVETTTSKSYYDYDSVAGKTYYYKVKAVCSKSAADSAYSAVVTRTCDLAKPTGVKASITAKGYPKVKWNAVEGATAYEVYRAVQGGTFKLQKTTTSTSFINTAVTPGTTYFYKVKAICSKSAADSAFSSTVNTINK